LKRTARPKPLKGRARLKTSSEISLRFGPKASPEWTATWFMQEIAFCRRAWLEGGSWAALYDALIYAAILDERQRDQVEADDQVPVPRWALDSLLEIVLDASKRALSTDQAKDKPKGIGRHARWREQFLQDMEDADRFEAVEHIREARAILRGSGLKSDWEERAPWRPGMNQFARASVLLGLHGVKVDTDAQQIKAAHKRVRDRVMSNPWRYRRPAYYPNPKRKRPGEDPND
jgi:hypothetical protein